MGGFVSKIAEIKTHPVSFGLYRERVKVRDSHGHLNDKPGFGVDIDWEFVKRHRA